MEMIETLLINNHTEKGIADQEEIPPCLERSFGGRFTLFTDFGRTRGTYLSYLSSLDKGSRILGALSGEGCNIAV